MPDAIQPIVEFLTRVSSALGLKTSVEVEESPDGPRLNLTGEDAELLADRGDLLEQHVRGDLLHHAVVGVDERDLAVGEPLVDAHLPAARLVGQRLPHRVDHQLVELLRLQAASCRATLTRVSLGR